MCVITRPCPGVRPTGHTRTSLVAVVEEEVALAVEVPAGEDVAKAMDEVPTKAKATTIGYLMPNGNR